MDSNRSKVTLSKAELQKDNSLGVKNNQRIVDPLSPVNRTLETTLQKVFPEIKLHAPNQGSPKKKKLLLDLDGTLIATYDTKPDLPCSTIQMAVGGRTFTFFVTVRSGLDNFVSTLSEYYEIQLYTAGYREFAEAVTREFDLDFYISKIFHREHCVQSASGKYIKDLSLIGADADSTILIDDADFHRELQPQNTLIIRTFTSDEKDETLSELIPFLTWVSKKTDVRPIQSYYEDYFAEGPYFNRFAEVFGASDEKLKSQSKVPTVCLDELDLEDDVDKWIARRKTTSSVRNFVTSQTTARASNVQRPGFSPEVRKKIDEFNKSIF